MFMQTTRLGYIVRKGLGELENSEVAIRARDDHADEDSEPMESVMSCNW